MADFRLQLLSSLYDRNKLEREPYKKVLNQYSHLMECVAELKQQNEHLKSLSSTGFNASPSTDEERLRKENARLKEEVTDLLRRKSENAQQLIDTNNKLQIRDHEVSEIKHKLAKLEDENAGLKEANRRLQEQYLDREKTNQLLNDEHLALQAAFNSLEEKYRKSQEELSSMVDRFKDLKSREADIINRENEFYQKQKEQKLQNELVDATKVMVPDNDDANNFELVSDGKRVVPVCMGSMVPSRCKLRIDAHEGEVNCVRFTPSGKFLITAGADRKIKKWEIVDGNRAVCQCSFTGCNQAVMSVEIDSDETSVLAASNDNAVRIWSFSDQRVRHTLTGHTDKVMAAKFMSSTMRVVSGSKDRTVKLWDLRSRVCAHSFIAMSSCFDLVTSEGPGAHIISGHFDRKLRMYDSNSKDSVHELLMAGKISSLDLSMDRFYLLVCCRDESLHYLDLRTNREVRAFTAEGFHTSLENTRAVLSPDGQYCVAGSSDDHLYVWNILTGKLEKVLMKGHSAAVVCTAWCPDGLSIASGDRQRTVCFWSDY